MAIFNQDNSVSDAISPQLGERSVMTSRGIHRDLGLWWLPHFILPKLPPGGSKDWASVRVPVCVPVIEPPILLVVLQSFE